MLSVSIIGAGVVGTSLAYLLKKHGYSIAGIASRTLHSAKRAREFIGEGVASTDLPKIARKADIVFITTSDNAIENTCKRISSQDGFKEGSFVFHTCGALSSEVLRSARRAGAKIASIHPLQSLANVREAVKNLDGSYFCIEGDEDAVSIAREIVAALKGKEIAIEADKKPLYHAGAAVASNFLVATVSFGIDLFGAANINRKKSLDALIPLVEGTVKNIESLGIPEALTGPISRGDTAVIEDHLRVMSKRCKELLPLYCALGTYTVRLALEKGTLQEKAADRINSLLNKYQKGLSTQQRRTACPGRKKHVL